MMNTNEEQNVNPIEVMNQIARNFLDLNAWGFQESYRVLKPGKLIFDSEWCRLNFIWNGWDPQGGNTISIRYGRLHALNDTAVMVWENEKCRCWHDFDHALHFLDGSSPSDTVKMIYSHPVTNPFFDDQVRRNFHRRQPEWLTKMHAAVWQHYGKRFFELFDLRRPDLWTQYQQFLQEFYDIKGRSLAIKPPSDKVC
jgi:hypothetical protein